ncbi:MAG: hypothetical protein MUP71_03545 [Candidatus Aminicenantes bacterium]|nr:hypothetical protein [Candidatus Aminicenantes bacterium]
MLERRTIRYIEAFKLQIIQELESGKLNCVYQAQERCGITGFGVADMSKSISCNYEIYYAIIK